MCMSYEILEHTGDVRLKVSGETKEQLFQDAVKGMFGILKPKIEDKVSKVRPVNIKSSDINALLVDFLSEVNYVRQVRKEAYEEVSFTRFSDTELQGELRGYAVEEFGEDIKAVTFHELNIQKNPQGLLETNIVFDV